MDETALKRTGGTGRTRSRITRYAQKMWRTGGWIYWATGFMAVLSLMLLSFAYGYLTAVGPVAHDVVVLQKSIATVKNQQGNLANELAQIQYLARASQSGQLTWHWLWIAGTVAGLIGWAFFFGMWVKARNPERVVDYSSAAPGYSGQAPAYEAPNASPLPARRPVLRIVKWVIWLAVIVLLYHYGTVLFRDVGTSWVPMVRQWITGG